MAEHGRIKRLAITGLALAALTASLLPTAALANPIVIKRDLDQKSLQVAANLAKQSNPQWAENDNESDLDADLTQKNTTLQAAKANQKQVSVIATKQESDPYVTSAAFNAAKGGDVVAVGPSTVLIVKSDQYADASANGKAISRRRQRATATL